MLTLKSYVGHNIQSHVNVSLVFPETGLIRFCGENSNGKSVMRKPLQYLLDGSLSKPIRRASLVNYNAAFGTATYERSDGAILLIHINTEASDTYAELTLPGQPVIRRYLADKNMSQLAVLFGFHLDEDSGVSLNICDGDDPLLFYRTKHKVNYSVLSQTITDTAAEKVVSTCDELLASARNLSKHCKIGSASCKSAIDGLTIYPVEEEQLKIRKLRYFRANLLLMEPPVIPEIIGVPDVTFMDIVPPILPEIKNPDILDASISIPDITDLATEICDLEKGVCPTCGRRWCDDEH